MRFAALPLGIAVNRNAIGGAVLVGGRSRRMGADKATLRLTPDGPTLIETIVQTLASVTDDVALVGADAAARSDLDLPWVNDTIADAGPLAGIHAALLASPHDAVLVVSCDMPFLNADLLRYMTGLPRDYDVLVPYIGQVQPLHAIYTRACLPLIAAVLPSGRRRVDGWFDRADLRMIDEPTVRRFDPDLRSCFNVNTPADLARARMLAGIVLAEVGDGDGERCANIEP